tara:strand:+ start:133 stop:636 length:504 start_codon:yes stop_codon:yes gene_type:complete
MNIFKANIVCLIIALSSSAVFAQDTDWRTYKKSSFTTEIVERQQNDTVKKELNYNEKQGNVVIYQDPKIDSLSNKIGKKPFINGYTIQIEVSQQKSIIRNSRYLFIRNNPDISLDEEYDQPNTYLFAGRFYDKNSAYKFKHKIKSDFPKAMVIKKKLNLPPLKLTQE